MHLSTHAGQIRSNVTTCDHLSEASPAASRLVSRHRPCKCQTAEKATSSMRHLNLTCISGFEATGVERALELSNVEARHVDAARTLLRGNICKRLNRTRRQRLSSRRGHHESSMSVVQSLRSESRRSHFSASIMAAAGCRHQKAFTSWSVVKDLTC